MIIILINFTLISILNKVIEIIFKYHYCEPSFFKKKNKITILKYPYLRTIFINTQNFYYLSKTIIYIKLFVRGKITFYK